MEDGYLRGKKNILFRKKNGKDHFDKKNLFSKEDNGKKLLEKKKKKEVLGYPTSVVEGIGDEFISVRESLIS